MISKVGTRFELDLEDAKRLKMSEALLFFFGEPYSDKEESVELFFITADFMGSHMLV